MADLDLLTADPPAPAAADKSPPPSAEAQLRAELAKSYQEMDILKAEKSQLTSSLEDARAQLATSKEECTTNQRELKKSAEDLTSLRKELESWSAKESEWKSQHQEDMNRSKQSFGEIKKQLYQQLVAEKEKTAKLEQEVVDLRKEKKSPSLGSTARSSKAASALTRLGFGKKRERSTSPMPPSEASKSPATSPRPPPPSAPPSSKSDQFRAPSATSSPVPAESAGDSSDGLARERLQAKTLECEKLAREVKELEDRCTLLVVEHEKLKEELSDAQFSKDEILATSKNAEKSAQDTTISLKEDLQTLKTQLQQSEVDSKNRMELLATEYKGKLAMKERELEKAQVDYKNEIASLKEDHTQAREAMGVTLGKLSSDLQISRSKSVSQGLELEKAQAEMQNYRTRLEDAMDKSKALEQRKKRLDKEKKALVKEIKRLKEVTGSSKSEVASLNTAKGALEERLKVLEEDHVKKEGERVARTAEVEKLRALYTAATEERESAVTNLENQLRTTRSKIKTTLDAAQAILMTLDNMKLEKLRASTPGMKDPQRLQWANNEIRKSLLPHISKAMHAASERVPLAKEAKSIVSGLLVTLCRVTLAKNTTLLQVGAS